MRLYSELRVTSRCYDNIFYAQLLNKILSLDLYSTPPISKSEEMLHCPGPCLYYYVFCLKMEIELIIYLLKL